MVNPYYANPDISFNSNWQSVSFLNGVTLLTRSQILSSSNSEESIYTFPYIL